MSEEFQNEEEKRQRHRRRIEEMQRSKRRQMFFRRCVSRYFPAAGCLIILSGLVFGTIKTYHGPAQGKDDSQRQENGEDTDAQKGGADESAGKQDAPQDGEGDGQEGQTKDQESEYPGGEKEPSRDQAGSAELTDQAGDNIGDQNGDQTAAKYSAQRTAATKQVGDEIFSEFAIFIDPERKTVLAEKGGFTVINPASMTKVLTVLVAAEQIQEEDLEDTITMAPEITDYGYIHKCSAAGFAKGEIVTVRDLFYGTILPSGADAAVGLAVYVSGDQDSFVELMNEKLKELGLSDTAHFTNCVGVYDEDHYCTAYDMAMILEAALDNALCREVLSTRMFTTTKTQEHPEGLELSNWFLRRIEDEEYEGEVKGGKTGYVVQSGSCAASFGENSAGESFICVTVNAGSPFQCVDDHALLYREYTSATATASR